MTVHQGNAARPPGLGACNRMVMVSKLYQYHLHVCVFLSVCHDTGNCILGASLVNMPAVQYLGKILSFFYILCLILNVSLFENL